MAGVTATRPSQEEKINALYYVWTWRRTKKKRGSALCASEWLCVSAPQCTCSLGNGSCATELEAAGILFFFALPLTLYVFVFLHPARRPQSSQSFFHSTDTHFCNSLPYLVSVYVCVRTCVHAGSAVRCQVFTVHLFYKETQKKKEPRIIDALLISCP